MYVLLALTGGFSAGIFLRSLVFAGWEWAAYALLLALLFAFAHLLAPRRAWLLAALFFALAALGMCRYALADRDAPPAFTAMLRHRASFAGVVAGEPDLRDATERVPIRIESGGAHTLVLAVAPRSEAVEVGDRVEVSGTLEAPAPFAGDNGRLFRYDKYLEERGIRFLLDYAYVRVESPAPWYSLPAAFSRAKHAFVSGVNQALPEPYSSLASGIVIGGKSGLGPELETAFSRSGLTQIIVLSGYNIMVVAEWVMALFGALGLSRKRSSLAGALALVIFVAIAGVSATSVRAALMALIALYARATGRSYRAGRALLTAVLCMLVWNPFYLPFDPGFALSVAATAGLIYLASGIERALGFMRYRFLRDALATTIAAQIAVLPLLLYFIGTLSFVALPANILVMPFMPLAMAFAALAGMSGMLVPGAAPFLGLPAYLSAAFLIAVAQKSAAPWWAALSVPAFPFAYVLAAYAALIYLAASSKRFSMTDQLRLSKNASI